MQRLCVYVVIQTYKLLYLVKFYDLVMAVNTVSLFSGDHNIILHNIQTYTLDDCEGIYSLRPHLNTHTPYNDNLCIHYTQCHSSPRKSSYVFIKYQLQLLKRRGEKLSMINSQPTKQSLVIIL